ncbi:hypothetical protein NQ317_012179 [Molorchus minor]|uniref:CHK kinase-like domain-containing protein n=1 Tax=Molorchus minor TaxID=1323400 RepID=A0ABQ9K446_9CUCU|nr:hypothetical protein NQ317_012179 [Molorchus minor]
MAEIAIKKPEELVKGIIGRKKSVTDVKVTRLTAPGENNVSLVLKVDYVIRNEENGSEEELNTVAKVMPLDDFSKKFHGHNYNSEVAFYNIIVPTLQDFQREQGVDKVIDLFPKIIKCRSNLSGNDGEVDEDSVILMENLRGLGYENVDRMVGIDLETTKLILKDLALLHALPLALNLLRPKTFKEKVAPYLTARLFPPPPPEGDDLGGPPKHELLILEILQEDEEFREVIPVMEEHLKNPFTSMFTKDPELFSSIVHGDLWVNNIMTRFENNKPIENKFVDFQMYTGNSICRDLFFFLWTSSQETVLEKNFDELVKLYYDHFIENLKQLKCDTKPFTFEKFLEDFARVVLLEIGHVLLMIAVVVFVIRYLVKMAEITIKKPEGLVKDIIGKKKSVADVKITRLTAPGENNLSIMLKVDYVIKNEENGSEEELNAVAKIMPTEGFSKDFYQHNYNNEKNLNGNDGEVDEDSVILMENLQTLGYQNVDRMTGIDLETTKLILKDLALFHAVPLALNLLRPETFKNKVEPHLIREPPRPPEGEQWKPPPHDLLILEFLQEDEEFRELIPAIEEHLKKPFTSMFTKDPDPFSSISHGDLWVNNIMTRFENNNPLENKFVDFQMYNRNSISRDLSFFLWTSLQETVLEKNFDELVKLYYDYFIENLERLKCDTKPFTFEKFLEDFATISQLEIGHVLIMTAMVVFGKKGGLQDENGQSLTLDQLKKEHITPEAIKRTKFIIKKYVKRGWM